eukprot:31686_1
MSEQEDEYDNFNESDKISIQKMLNSMGFLPNYIDRAFKIYEKNYGYGYNIEVITDIIVRLQCKDEVQQNRNDNNDNAMMDMKSEEKVSVCTDNNNADDNKQNEEWNPSDLIPPQLNIKRVRHVFVASQEPQDQSNDRIILV